MYIIPYLLYQYYFLKLVYVSIYNTEKLIEPNTILKTDRIRFNCFCVTKNETIKQKTHVEGIFIICEMINLLVLCLSHALTSSIYYKFDI